MGQARLLPTKVGHFQRPLLHQAKTTQRRGPPTTMESPVRVQHQGYDPARHLPPPSTNAQRSHPALRSRPAETQARPPDQRPNPWNPRNNQDTESPTTYANQYPDRPLPPGAEAWTMFIRNPSTEPEIHPCLVYSNEYPKLVKIFTVPCWALVPAQQSLIPINLPPLLPWTAPVGTGGRLSIREKKLQENSRTTRSTPSPKNKSSGKNSQAHSKETIAQMRATQSKSCPDLQTTPKLPLKQQRY